jgi:hypothetical protein
MRIKLVYNQSMTIMKIKTKEALIDNKQVLPKIW